jgi:HK97 family phage major capsid protein
MPGVAADPNAENAEKILQEFKATMEQLSEKQREQEKHAKEHGEKSEKLDREFKALEKRYDDQLEQYKELVTKIEELQTKANRPGTFFGVARTESEMKSIGQKFVESEEFKGAIRRKAYRTDSPVELGSMFTKTLTSATTGVGAAGDAIDPYRRPGIVSPPTEQPSIRSLLERIPIQTGTVEYVRETNFYELYTELSSGISATDTSIPVDNAAGFYPGQSITIGSETATIAAAGVDLNTNTLTITAGVAGDHAVDTAVTSSDFVFTPETYLKPRSEATLDLLSASVKTLAHHMAASRQMLADVPALRQWIDQRLVNSAIFSHEKQLLYGAGGSSELDGIMMDSDIQTYSWSAGESGDTQLDALRRAMTLAAKAHYPVDGAVISHDTWEDIELLKATDGQYVFVETPSAGGQPMVWRVPVVPTTAIEDDDALVGSFQMGATYWDREQATLQMTDSHSDYFLRNIIVMLLEERGCLTVNRPESFVSVDLDSAPA